MTIEALSSAERIKRLQELIATLSFPVNYEAYKKFFDISPDALLIVDKEGTIVGINAQAELMFGHQAIDVVGKKIEIFVPEALRETHVEKRNAFIKTPRVRHNVPMGVGLDLKAVNKQGEIFDVFINLDPLITDGNIYTLATVRRKKGEGS